MLKIGKFVLSSCATNCYFVYEEGKKDVIFFDPGDQGELIYEKLKQAGFSVAAIYLTHGHFDHIGGCNELRKLSGAKVYALDEEADICQDAKINLSEAFGRSYTVEPDGYVHDGDICTEAGISFRVIATPGHTKGSCVFYFEEDGILVGGDTLFLESVGRTDFPTGSAASLVRNVREKLFVLPDEVKVFSGHGESTTIGHEKKYNPFLQ
ncbi:MAG: MBL fold metallo-hydrolase [Lachnospiraceae bacterium]|nr:MBL fold metallo-hydrolase [Lachnospiraceae bacterium]